MNTVEPLLANRSMLQSHPVDNLLRKGSEVRAEKCLEFQTIFRMKKKPFFPEPCEASIRRLWEFGKIASFSYEKCLEFRTVSETVSELFPNNFS